MTSLDRKAWHILKQNGRCVLCGEPLLLDKPVHTYGSFTIEHKLPKVHGGVGLHDNRAGSHRECNQWRKDRTTLKCVRPPAYEDEPEPRRRKYVVRAPGIWWSHFKIPLDDPRWLASPESGGNT